MLFSFSAVFLALAAADDNDIRCIRTAPPVTAHKLLCNIIAWRAMRITKDQQYPLAAILFECDGTPVYIRQGEIRGNAAGLQTVTLNPTLTEWFHARAAPDGTSYLHSGYFRPITQNSVQKPFRSFRPVSYHVGSSRRRG